MPNKVLLLANVKFTIFMVQSERNKKSNNKTIRHLKFLIIVQLVAYVFTLSPSKQIKDPVGLISLPSFEMNIVKTGEEKGACSEAHASSQQSHSEPASTLNNQALMFHP